MKTIITTIVATTLVTSFIGFSIYDYKRVERNNEESYQATDDFISECYQNNGIYSEAKISKTKKKMLCATPFEKTN